MSGLRRGAHRRWLWAAGVVLVGGVLAGIVGFVRLPSTMVSDTAVAVQADFVADLSASGTLKPISSITYRAPLAGRELEILELIPEGSLVQDGERLVRLDSSELERDADRARQELRQAKMELNAAHVERQDAEAALNAVNQGEGAVSVEESKVRLQLYERKVDRLQHEVEQLTPLLSKGYLTREELRKTTDELEQAQQELTLVRRRTEVLVGLTHPRDQQRAELQLAQKSAAVENMATKVVEAETRVAALDALIQNCRVTARRPGLVVYEDYLNAATRRKVRVGDRVTGSQGLVTIPEVDRMMLETSVGEGQVHRVKAGQIAAVRVEAFPGVVLKGRVARVGTLAQQSADRPLDDKRFDVVIELDATEIELRPDMSARADIRVAARRRALQVPINAIFERDEQSIVYVVHPDRIELRHVEIGETNESTVEVTRGLVAGERVALVAPDQTEQMTATPLERDEPRSTTSGMGSR